jgi:hypothetical protein
LSPPEHSLDKHLLPELKEIALGLGITPAGNKTRRETWVVALVGQPFPLFQSIELEQAAEKSLDVDRAQEPIELPAENSLGVSGALEPIENSRGVDRIQALESIENSPGVARALESIEVQALEPFELPTEKSPGVASALEPIEFPDPEAALA